MGRPRQFCLEAALEKALEVFWRRGFAGASMAELTAAMGITRPSLYASYGNKEELFRKALDLYDVKYMGFLRDALAEASALDVARAVLVGTARATVGGATTGGPGAAHPAGCLSVNAALSCAAAAEPIRIETVRRRQLFEAELARRFARAASDSGDGLPPGGEPVAMASYVMTVACGIAWQALAGVPYATLCATAGMALAGWPEAQSVRPAGSGASRAEREVAPVHA